MERKTDQSPIEEFLFERKEGHCEYFASAMAVLLRLNGIPSRVINGFSTTEWNDLGGYLVVRQAHAHSWVEAFIEGVGWKVYDPTPPDPTAVSRHPSTFSRRLDLIRLYWQRYVIRYSARDQADLAHYFSGETRNLKTRWKEWKIPSPQEMWEAFQRRPWILLILGAGILVGASGPKSIDGRGRPGKFALRFRSKCITRC